MGITPNLDFFLIVHLDNIETGKKFSLCNRFKFCNGVCVLGGFIVDNDPKNDWLQDCMEIWENIIRTIIKSVGKYPQESYSAVV